MKEAKVIAISNQKGGVGKTTSSINISAELARAGFRVLLVDFDPQGSATSGLGIKRIPGKDIYDMFFGDVSLHDIIVDSCIPTLKVAPASKDLVGLEIELGKRPGRELILRTELNLLKELFDYVIIDCPPSSGLLTLNALGAAKYVLIPLQAEYYALEGITALIETISFVKATYHPGLEILGVFLTMYDSRTNLSLQVKAEAESYFGEKFINILVPRNVKVSEAPSHGLPICMYDASSTGAKAYKLISDEVIARTDELADEIHESVPRGTFS